MSWNDVKANINVTGYTPSQTQAIYDDFQDAYENSDRAQELLDQLTPTNQMDINFRSGAAFAAPADGNYSGEGFLTRGVYFDPAMPSGLSIIDDTGTVGAFTQQYVLLHEAVHLIEGKKDLDGADRAGGKHYTGFGDYLGDTERVTKEILNELGVDMQRASYGSAGPRPLMPIGTEYTNGTSVDNAVVTGGNPVYTDQFYSSDSDLVVGLGSTPKDIRTGRGEDFVHSGDGNDTVDLGSGNDHAWLGGGNDEVVAGKGNDEIYAGAGNDSINPGSGNDIVLADLGDDIIIGGKGSDQIDGGAGLDTVDYTSMRGAGFGSYTSGLTVSINGNEATVEATEYISTSMEMFPSAPLEIAHTDTLKDIENIVGSNRVDTFTLENISGNMYISGGAGNDTLTVKDPAGVYSLNMTGGTYPAGHPRAGETYTGTVSDGTNTIYLEDKDLTVTIETPTPPAPEVEKSAEITLKEALETLDADLHTLNQQAAETGVSSPALEAINHPDAHQMMKNLHDGGIAVINADISDDMSAEERVGKILNAGKDATQEAGLPMPHEDRKMEVEPSTANRNTPELAYEDDHSYSL